MIYSKKEIEEYLDEVLARETASNLDVTLNALRKAKCLCVFGMGAISYPIISAIRTFTDLRIDFLCDNDPAKWGKVFHGDLTCLPPSELEKYGDKAAVLVTTQHYRDIRRQLSSRGINNVHVLTEYRLLNDGFFRDRENLLIIRDKVGSLMEMLADNRSQEILYHLVRNWFDFDIRGEGYSAIHSNDQYYPAGIIQLQQDEAFVDAGAYNGDTVMEFIERVGRRFSRIFAFELDRSNFLEMEANIGRLDKSEQEKIRLYNVGLYDEDNTIHYEAGGSGKQSTSINVIGSATEVGRIMRLSGVLADEQITFIKMDIEGAELKALQGAEEVIRDQKPKLAICVYHRPTHLWEVPLYLKNIVPEYKIYLRHHTPLEYETVCYAVMD